MHLLRSGSSRLGRGIGEQSHAGTRSVPSQRVCARPLHAGASGPPRERPCRPEVLRRVKLRVSGGSRLLHPAELARGLPTTEPGEAWSALRSIMQFADLLQWGAPEPGRAT